MSSLSRLVPRRLISGRTLVLSRCLLLSPLNSGRRLPRPTAIFVRSAVSTSGEHVEQLIDPLSDNEYSRAANTYLESLSDELEELAETFPQLDVELSLGVMTLSVGDLTYVINKQPPNKQIWLSSPISGPKRFDMIGGRWVTLRDGSALTDLLREELLAQLGDDVELPLEA